MWKVRSEEKFQGSKLNPLNQMHILNFSSGKKEALKWGLLVSACSVNSNGYH